MGRVTRSALAALLLGTLAPALAWPNPATVPVSAVGVQVGTTTAAAVQVGPVAVAAPATVADPTGAPAAAVGAPASSEIVFDEPVASGDLGENVVFETTFRAAEPPSRVELVRGGPDDPVVAVSLAAVEPAGEGTWRARVVQAGHVAPNTAYRFHFRSVDADGRQMAGPEGFHRVRDTRFDWRQLRGNEVTVWWYEGDEAFAARALDVAEEAITVASTLLGISGTRPVDFFIYADDRDMRAALGPATRENVGGEAHPDIDTLFGLIGPRQVESDWVAELVGHELTHLVFDEATQNPYAYPPRWMNEGLAVHVSRGIDDGDRDQVAAAARSDAIIPLEGLAGQFPTRPGRFSLAYAESVSAVDHLLERHGDEALREIVTALRDGADIDEAFHIATGAGFAAFEDGWLAAIGARRTKPYGPLPAPPAPLSAVAPSAPGALLR